MPLYTCRADIAAPPAEVFSVLTDPARVRLWNSTLLELRFVDDEGRHLETDPTPGTALVQRVNEGGDHVEYHGKVKTFDRPGHYAYRLDVERFEMDVDFRLEPSEEGTHVDYQVFISPHTWSARLMTLVFGGYNVRIMEDQLEQVAAIAEPPQRRPELGHDPSDP